MIQTIHATEHLTPDMLCACVDGELATGTQQMIQRHLTSCHSCTLRALSAAQLKTAIAHIGLRIPSYPFDSSDWGQIPRNDPVQTENQAILVEVLNRIQPPFREPLLLRDVGEVKYHDIGAILDLPVDTVISRISIARDVIGQILQQQFGEPK